MVLSLRITVKLSARIIILIKFRVLMFVYKKCIMNICFVSFSKILTLTWISGWKIIDNVEALKEFLKFDFTNQTVS